MNDIETNRLIIHAHCKNIFALALLTHPRCCNGRFVSSDIIKNISNYFGYQILLCTLGKEYLIDFSLKYFTVKIHFSNCHELMALITEKKYDIINLLDVVIKKKHVVCQIIYKSSKQHFSHNDSLKSYCSEMELMYQPKILQLKLNLPEDSPEFQTLKQSFHPICECVLNTISDSLKVPESNYYGITNGHQFEQENIKNLLNNIVTHWIKNYSE